MSEYITHSRAETVALGKRMAAVLAPGALIAFTGGLGAGKTAFTEGLAEGLGCTDHKVSAFLIYYSMIKAKCCRNLLTAFFFGKKTGGIASFL